MLMAKFWKKKLELGPGVLWMGQVCCGWARCAVDGPGVLWMGQVCCGWARCSGGHLVFCLFVCLLLGFLFVLVFWFFCCWVFVVVVVVVLVWFWFFETGFLCVALAVLELTL
jgi:hypothetical protein